MLVKDEFLQLKNYFQNREEIAFAYVFGSFAKGISRTSSDVDIAIYYFPENNIIDFEVEKYFESEDIIWGDLEDILKKEVDLLVLNRAASTVAFNAIRGIEIINKDFELFYKFFNYVMYDAIDYNEMILRDYKEGILS